MEPVISRRAVLGGMATLGMIAAGCGRERGDEPAAAPTAPGPPTSPSTAVTTITTTTTTTPAPADVVPPPGDAWPTVDPQEVGWDPAGLEAVVAFAGERRTRSFVVVLDGRILVERHWAGATSARDIASAQKSVVSTLGGLAHHAGQLDLDAPVADYLGSGWSSALPAQEQRIAVHHLLAMTTGLDEALRVVAEPGTVWDYNNTTYQLVRPVVERATGIDIVRLTRERLWDPIGVSDSARWAPRPGTGRFAVDAKGNRFWGLTMGARDMARFGLLVQRRGRWGAATVIPEPELARALRPSQELNPSYGELWWLNGQTSYQLPQRPRQEGMLVPSAPSDMVAALGKDDQKIFVSRSTGLVVTRLGDRAGDQALASSSFDDLLWQQLLAAAP